MNKTELSRRFSTLSSENYLISSDFSELVSFFIIAIELNISLLIIDGINRSERDRIVNETQNNSFDLLSPEDLFFPLIEKYSTQKERYKHFKQKFYSLAENQLVIGTRITLDEQNIPNLKKKLADSRKKFDIVSIKLTNEKIAKWAAHDGRVDYLSIDTERSKVVDPALCSLVKQYNKCFEIPFHSFLLNKDQKSLSNYLRNGRKIFSVLDSCKAPYIFCMKPLSPYQLRNGYHLRHIGAFLGSSFNKSKKSIFDLQLNTLSDNLTRFHSGYIFNGVEEVSQ